MAGKIQIQYSTSGVTVYAVVRNSVGQVWSVAGSAFVTYATADLDDYDIPMTEQGVASRYYTADFPAGITPLGVYATAIFQQAGGSPAETDSVLTGGSIDWDGSSITGTATARVQSGTGTGQIKLSSGYVAPNWGDVGNPTTALNLSGTTIATTQKVDVETIKTNPVVNGGTVTFPTNATLASTTNITAGTLTTVATATNVTTVNGLAANVITAASIAADADTEIAGAVWDALTASYTASGSFGEAVGAGSGGSAAAVWSYPTRGLTEGVEIDMGTAVPGSPSSGTTGQALRYVLNRLDATVSSRGTGDATAAAQSDAQNSLDTLEARLSSARAGYLDSLSSGIPSTSDIADAVWDKDISGVVAADLAGTQLNAAATGGSGVADVQTDVDTLLARLTATRAGYLDNLSAAPPTAAAIATAVWDKDISAISTAGYAGRYLNNVPTNVWALGTRTLTSGANIVLAKGTGVTGFNDIAATAIVSNGAITTLAGAVVNVDTVDACTLTATTTTLTNKTGFSLAGTQAFDNTGTWTGDITGDITGNITGDITGGITGDITGDLVGNVTGNVEGNVEGSVASVAGDVTLSAGTVDDIAAGVLDLTDAVEAGVTVREALRAIAAMVAGQVSGAATGLETFKGIGTGAATTRVVVTTTPQGDRTNVTLTL